MSESSSNNSIAPASGPAHIAYTHHWQRISAVTATLDQFMKHGATFTSIGRGIQYTVPPNLSESVITSWLEEHKGIVLGILRQADMTETLAAELDLEWMYFLRWRHRAERLAMEVERLATVNGTDT